MESDKDIISFIVIASSGIVLLLIAIILDFFLLFRKRKTIARQEIELKERRIDELIRKQEIENVNTLLKGQNTERRRISQELHDRLGSILFTAKLYNGNIEKKLDEIKLEQATGYKKLTGLLDEAVDEVRRISHDLYEGSLAKFGFSTALRQLIGAIVEANGVKITLQADSDFDQQDEAMQHELYAITQEMLSNTLKHAQATKIEISVKVEDTIAYRYSDNGVGFAPSKSNDGIGLENIKQRAEKLNAEFKLDTAPAKGTLYYLSIPKP